MYVTQKGSRATNGGGDTKHIIPLQWNASHFEETASFFFLFVCVRRNTEWKI